MRGRVHDVADRVDRDGPGAAHVEQPLDPQHACPVGVQEHAQPDGEDRPVDGPVEAHGRRLGRVPVGGGRRAGDDGRLALAQQRIRGDELRRGVAGGDRGAQGARVGEVGLRDEHAVGGRELPRRRGRGERRRAGHGVDRAGDAREAELVHEHRVGGEREEDRPGVGDAARLHHDAAQVALAQEAEQGRDEVLAPRAAGAAAAHGHRDLVRARSSS